MICRDGPIALRYGPHRPIASRYGLYMIFRLYKNAWYFGLACSASVASQACDLDMIALSADDGGIAGWAACVGRDSYISGIDKLEPDIFCNFFSMENCLCGRGRNIKGFVVGMKRAEMHGNRRGEMFCNPFKFFFEHLGIIIDAGNEQRCDFQPEIGDAVEIFECFEDWLKRTVCPCFIEVFRKAFEIDICAVDI